MKKLVSRWGVAVGLAAVSLTAGATVVATVATAAGSHGVGAHAAKKKHRKGKRGPRGRRGPRGLTGPQGPAGPQGPQGPPGSSANLGGLRFQDFTSELSGSSSESITVGSFTIKEDAVAGVCSPIKVIDNSAFNWVVSALPDADGNPATPPTLESGGAQVTIPATDMTTFAASLFNGQSSLTATLGTTSEPNGTCLTFGYVTGH